MQWTVEAGLGFGVLPIAGTLRPKEQVLDLLRANDELTQQDRPYWAALDARLEATYN
jgi:hypothetical protein